MRKIIYIAIIVLLSGILIVGLVFHNTRQNPKTYEELAIAVVNGLGNPDEDFSQFTDLCDEQIIRDVYKVYEDRDNMELNLYDLFIITPSEDTAALEVSEVAPEDMPTEFDDYSDDLTDETSDERIYYTPEEVDEMIANLEAQVVEDGLDENHIIYTMDELLEIKEKGYYEKNIDTPIIYERDGIKYVKYSDLYPDILEGEYQIFLDGAVRTIPREATKEPMSSIRINPDYNMKLTSSYTRDGVHGKNFAYQFESITTSKRIVVTISIVNNKVNNITIGGID